MSSDQSPSKHYGSSGASPVASSQPLSRAFPSNVSVDIEEVRNIAHKFNYHETEHNISYSVITFIPRASVFVHSIQVYYDAGVAGVCFDHPRQGRSVAFRRRQSLSNIAELFQSPHNLPELGYIPDDMLPAHGMNSMDELTAYRTQLASLEAEAAEINREKQHLIACMKDREIRLKMSTFAMRPSPKNMQPLYDDNPHNNSSSNTVPSQPTASMPTYSPNLLRRTSSQPQHPPASKYNPPPAPPASSQLREYVHEQRPFLEEHNFQPLQPPPPYSFPTVPFQQQQYHYNQLELPPQHRYFSPHTYAQSFHIPTGVPVASSQGLSLSSQSASTTSSRLTAARNTLAALELAHAKARNHQQTTTTNPSQLFS